MQKEVCRSPAAFAGVLLPDFAHHKLKQARLVASSRKGRRIDVPEASHEVQIDAPEVVVRAVAP